MTVVAWMVVAANAGAAHAEVAFRKKKPPTTDSTGTEAAPTGGDQKAAGDSAGAASGGAAAGGEAAPAEDTTPKPAVPQAEDPDRPHDPSLLAKPRTGADVTTEKQGRPQDEGPPFYKKWQFWAITGAIVVGAVAAVWGGSKLVHEANGGDIRPCNMMVFVTCQGQGR
jgi:hypothetical protein